MAVSQSGSRMAAQIDVGGGLGPADATLVYLGLGLRMPALARVVMWCGTLAGTGADRGGGAYALV